MYVVQIALHCPSSPAPPLQKSGQDAVRVNAPEHLQSVANLLGVVAKDLEVSVTNKVTFTRGELFYTPLTVDQALDTRQAEKQSKGQYSSPYSKQMQFQQLHVSPSLFSC